MVSPKACGCGWEDWHLARRQLSSNLNRIAQPTSARGRGLATTPAAASAMAFHHVDVDEVLARRRPGEGKKIAALAKRSTGTDSKDWAVDAAANKSEACGGQAVGH